MYIIFDLTQLVIKPMIYCNRDEQVNYYITDTV